MWLRTLVALRAPFPCTGFKAASPVHDAPGSLGAGVSLIALDNQYTQSRCDDLVLPLQYITKDRVSAPWHHREQARDGHMASRAAQ